MDFAPCFVTMDPARQVFLSVYEPRARDNEADAQPTKAARGGSLPVGA